MVQDIGNQAIQDIEKQLEETLKDGSLRAIEAAEAAFGKMLKKEIGVELKPEELRALALIAAKAMQDPRGSFGELGRRLNAKIDSAIQNLKDETRTDLLAAQILFLDLKGVGRDLTTLSAQGRKDFERANQIIANGRAEILNGTFDGRGIAGIARGTIVSLGAAGKEFFRDVVNFERAERVLEATARLGSHFMDPLAKKLTRTVVDEKRLREQSVVTKEGGQLDLRGTARNLLNEVRPVSEQVIGSLAQEGKVTAEQAAMLRMNVQRFETARTLYDQLARDPAALQRAMMERPEVFVGLARSNGLINDTQASNAVRALAAAQLPKSAYEFAQNLESTLADEFRVQEARRLRRNLQTGYDDIGGLAMPNPFPAVRVQTPPQTRPVGELIPVPERRDEVPVRLPPVYETATQPFNRRY